MLSSPAFVRLAIDVVVGLDVAGADRARALLRQAQLGLVTRVEAQRDQLQVEQDVDDVFLHAFDAGVFVQHAVDFDFRDGTARHRGQQHAPQRVAERVAEAPLERFDRDLGVTRRRRGHLHHARTEEFRNG
jgi:hypothetical protein